MDNAREFFTSPEKHIIDVSLYNLTIYSLWHSDLIEIKILNQSNKCQYTGIILIEDIKCSAQDLEIPFEEFYKELKEALAATGGLENFEYTIQNNTFMIQKNETFKITYLEILVSETTEDLKDFFINESINIINSMQENLSILKRKSEKDTSDYNELEKTCKKIIDEKDSLEKNLLSKFVVLLNSKKDKIIQLQEEISKNKIRNKSKVNDNSENDYEMDTDKNDSDENEDVFNVQTQKLMPESSQSSQTPQTQLKIINLPKRKNIEQPSTSKVITLPKRKNIEQPSTSSSNIHSVSNENSSEESQEIFKIM